MPLTKEVLPLVFTGISAGGIVLLDPEGITGGFSVCSEEAADTDTETTGGSEELTTAAEEMFSEEIIVSELLKKLVSEELMIAE